MTKKDIELVSQQSAQAVREAKVRVAFANMAATLLRFLASSSNLDIITPMIEFLEIHEAMETESEDPKGIAIRFPDISPVPDGPDEALNTLIRGVLRQFAAFVEDQHQKGEAYEAGRAELVRGLFAMNKKMGIPSLDNINKVRRRLADWAMPGGSKRPGKDDLMNTLLLLKTHDGRFAAHKLVREHETGSSKIP